MNAKTVISTLHPNAQGDGGDGVIVVTPPGGSNEAIRFSRTKLANIKGSVLAVATALQIKQDWERL